MDDLKSIGENVERAIKAQGYPSVELFAHEHGIDKAILSRLINGKQGVNLRTFLRIASALSLTPNDLVSMAAPHPEEKAAREGGRLFKSWQKKAKRTTKPKTVLILSETESFEVRKDPKAPNTLIIRVKLPPDYNRTRNLRDSDAQFERFPPA